MLGFDLDDTAYLPVATAMKLFNLGELWEIDVLYSHAGLAAEAESAVRRLLTERHGGNEDFSVTPRRPCSRSSTR